jgi:hypothetical protein
MERCLWSDSGGNEFCRLSDWLFIDRQRVVSCSWNKGSPQFLSLGMLVVTNSLKDRMVWGVALLPADPIHPIYRKSILNNVLIVKGKFQNIPS